MLLKFSIFLISLIYAFFMISITSGESIDFNRNNVEFTIDLLNETLKASDKTKNIIISPLSIQTCLALAFIGAGGKTAEELSTGLRLGSLDKDIVASNFNDILTLSQSNPLIKIASRIFAQKNINIMSNFNEIAQKYFNAAAENVDFMNTKDTAKHINKWVEEQTNDKIQNLIDPSSLNSNTYLILVNAIYFRGEWKKPFTKLLTRKEKFWHDENDLVDVDMMYVEDGFKYAQIKDLDAVAVQLPYNNSDLSMILIVPNKKTGLKDIENNLDSLDLSAIENKLRIEEVSLNIPKFKNEFSVLLNSILMNMGMTSLFNDNANFTQLTSTSLRVDEVYHKAVIEVDEIGTEATAATYVRAVPLSLNLNIKHVIADRPFMYFIKDSRAVYFMGRVSKF